jgi:GNAT superfamily N-acetyltransferase
MIKAIPVSEAIAELADGLVGRPMTEAEFGSWRAEAVRGYAADITDSGALSAAEAAAAAETQFDQLLPAGLRTANHTFLSVISNGEVVATNWIGHHYRGPDMSWVFGVETREAHRGKGYGRAAMILGERATRAAGDAYLGLNVFGHNVVAISMYESMGYWTYDHSRSVEL